MGWPTANTISCTMPSATTYIKSSWTPKVNSILYMCPIPPHVNGILPHASVLCILSYDPTSATQAGGYGTNGFGRSRGEDGVFRGPAVLPPTPAVLPPRPSATASATATSGTTTANIATISKTFCYRKSSYRYLQRYHRPSYRQHLQWLRIPRQRLYRHNTAVQPPAPTGRAKTPSGTTAVTAVPPPVRF